ncbi:MAG: amino acid adenylation domain-containing protein [Flavobacterium sp.]|nr:amino acid adenylation domain-containing protein [Flavobacterium sp.]
MSELSIVLGKTKPEFQKEETLVTVFKETVNLHPNKTALFFNDQSVTYFELDQWSTAFAASLQAKGLKQGDACVVWWHRSIELHVAILAILKCGATYVPIDFEMPQDRVQAVMNDIKTLYVITSHQTTIEGIVVTNIPFETKNVNLYREPVFSPDDYAYVLFTSGSTGKPKGIRISQRNICHLIRSENDVLHVNSNDKVYQGFSVSFDMWCEETWISYLVGASIWIADAITAKSIDELNSVLKEQNITVLHAVPSLLAVMEDIGLPKLRIINSGGEACNQHVLAKWSDGKRDFYNSYGPTETTVSSSFAKLKATDPITIGLPLPNYGLAVVDENMKPVKIGEHGELIVTGIGVSNGYLNLDALTNEKFLPKNEALKELPGTRLYRTGDATFMDADKNIHFIGRIDDQIKLRGYRIELGEIETLLSATTGVLQAAVTIKKDSNNQDQLTGYVVLNNTTVFNEALIKEQLAQKLPTYMVPYAIVKLNEVPRLPSGKINRKALPVPESYLASPELKENKIEDGDDFETIMKKILSSVFSKQDIHLTQDFFNDLGGHSLLAASFVSKMRHEGKVANASLKDIYQNRPLSELAHKWEQNATTKEKANTIFNKIPLLRYYACWFAQTLALVVIFGFLAAEIFIPYLAYYFTLLEHERHLYAACAALLMFCLIPPIYILLGILVKWLVIGKYKEGTYPLWGTYYFRWWFVNTFQRIVPTQFMNGTPLYPNYLRLLGAKVASDAQLSSLTMGASDLVSIGADVCVSSNVVFDNVTVENGLLKLTSIKVGNHAYLGSSSIICGNTVMEDWSELQDLSCLQENKTIPYAEVWKGSPAALNFKRKENEFTQPLPVTTATLNKYKLLYTALLLLFPFFILLPLIPTIIIISELDNAAGDFEFGYLWVTPLLTIAYIVLFILETVVVSRWLQRDVKPGVYPVYSWFYIKKWLVDQLNSISLIVLHPIYATIFITPYFRAFGAKVGDKTEISTASNVTYPLVEIGERSFIADSVTLGEADVRGQQLLLDKTVIENNSFVGNSALVPQGYHLGSNMLIGVLSVPPTASQLEKEDLKDWFGSPAIAIPKRQESQAFDDSKTFSPTKKIIFYRGVVEFIRIILPQTIILISSIYFIAYTSELLYNESIWKILTQLPFYYLFFMGFPVFLITVILKWLLVGKYKATNIPMWNIKVWLSELITSTYEALAIPFLLEYLKGTPWLPLLLKFYGVKTGKRIFLNTADFTEFDMVTLADDVALNEDSGAQTHLFEDRVMKIGTVYIGNRVSIGSRTIILYDTHIEDDVKIEPLSLVMKGETIQKNTSWGGSPISKI